MLKGYIASLVNPRFVPTGLKTAIIVGTLLFVINHGYAIAQREMTRDRWLAVMLTYLMPYLVNVHGQYSSSQRQQNG